MTQQSPVILITGGAQGIGKGIASWFLNKGWRVVVLDLDADAIKACRQDLGNQDKLLLIEADVSDEPDVVSAVAEAMEWGGRLDAVVSNAGIADPDTGPIEELELAQWRRRIDVNLTGAFLMAKHTVPHLRQSRDSIVNMASTRALQSEPDSEAYATYLVSPEAQFVTSQNFVIDGGMTRKMIYEE